MRIIVFGGIFGKYTMQYNVTKQKDSSVRMFEFNFKKLDFDLLSKIVIQNEIISKSVQRNSILSQIYEKTNGNKAATSPLETNSNSSACIRTKKV